MELRHLRYFVAVAEELHFGRAARRLHIAQPPLSQQIRRLEQEIGAILIDRSKRQVRLTEVGRVFAEEARRILDQSERAVHTARSVQRGEVGRLTVGFVGSATYMVLPWALRAFAASFPGVDLTLWQLTTTQQVQALRDARIDVGFLRPPVAADGLLLERIARESQVVALPSSHPLARYRRVPLSALAGERFVQMARPMIPILYDQIIDLCRGAGFSPEIVQEVQQLQTVVCLVAAGIGVAFVPESVRNLRQSGVTYRTLREPTPTTDMALAWRRDDPSITLRTFTRLVCSLRDGHVCGAPQVRGIGGPSPGPRSAPESNSPSFDRWRKPSCARTASDRA